MLEVQVHVHTEVLVVDELEFLAEGLEVPVYYETVVVLTKTLRRLPIAWSWPDKRP